jgi:hypothetical protein
LAPSMISEGTTDSSFGLSGFTGGFRFIGLLPLCQIAGGRDNPASTRRTYGYRTAGVNWLSISRSRA